MLALNTLRALQALDAFDLHAVALDGGPLAPEFSALCPLEILRPGDPDLPTKLATSLQRYRDRSRKIAFCNTVLTANLIPLLRQHGYYAVPLIHELAESIRQFGWQQQILLVDQQAQAIVFGSELVRKRNVEAFRLTNPNMHVVPTGYPEPHIDEAVIEASRARLRKEAGFPPDSFVVLGCGAVTFRKGTDIFINLAGIVSGRPEGKRFRFAWIGPRFSTPFSRECMIVSAALRADHRLNFMGERPDISPYMPGADLFALTSREDPFPLVNLAAMASRVPVLAFADAGGAPDAIEDDAGVVVPFLDIAALAKSALALAADPRRREALGAQAQQKFRSRYTMDRFLANLFTVLRGGGIAVPEMSVSAKASNE